MNNKAASIAILIIGIAFLLASLFAEQIGLGDNPGFGRQQTTGAIVSAIIIAVGAYFTIKANKSS